MDKHPFIWSFRFRPDRALKPVLRAAVLRAVSGFARAAAAPFARVLRERRASTAVDFAMVLGPLLALLLATLQTSLIFFAQEALQSAAMTAGRQIMTGTAQTTGTTQSAFQQAVCNLVGSMLPCSRLMVDVESAGSYGALGTGTPTLTYNNGAVNNHWAYNPGGPDDVVIVRVMYNWPILGAHLLPGLSDQPGGQRLLVGTSVFKNEPYP